jgi:hypothetical protein
MDQKCGGSARVHPYLMGSPVLQSPCRQPPVKQGFKSHVQYFNTVGNIDLLKAIDSVGLAPKRRRADSAGGGEILNTARDTLVAHGTQVSDGIWTHRHQQLYI